jgi:hypothetical protein
VCGVHMDEAHSSEPVHGAVGHHAPPAVATSPDQAAEVAPGHHQDRDHCAEERTVTARYDRTVSPSTDLAGVPPLAPQWLVPDITHHAARVPSGLPVAAAPSLHALGISRT